MSKSQLGLLALLLAACSAPEETVIPSVIVSVGPTPIPRGDAVGERDITVSNGLFMVSFAVDTAPPWGVARGGIVDIAPLRNGEPDFDIASLADFMPNNWSSWPTTYQRVSVERSTPAEAVIRTVRDWGDVELDTTFHIRGGDSRIHIVTQMTNKGATKLEDLLSGYVVWPDGGHLVAEPVVSSSDVVHAPGGWTAAYDEGWLLGLHAKFSDYVTRRGRDRYTQHELEAGASRTFEAWLQIGNRGELAPMVDTEIEFGDIDSGRIVGTVESSDGESVTQPAVIASRNGHAFAWAIGNDGRYEFDLPAGTYEVYATAAGYGRGESRQVIIAAGSETRVEFEDVPLPGEVRFRVSDATTGRPLDARIRILDGFTPLVGYFGKSTFFTELADVGALSQQLAPGRYVLEVAAGDGFVSLPRSIEAEVRAGEAQEIVVEIPITAAPAQRSWYSADLHHHSDVLDGFTDPEYVLRSQLAVGVDVTFLSDHDSVVNNEEMGRLAQTRGVPFIPGTELSASWGHFNAYPLDAGKTVEVDTGQATAQEIFEAARDMGADAVAVNHPYSEYGYFTSVGKNTVPGGHADGYDLIEVGPVLDNKGEPSRNRETMEHTWRLWNDGKRIYLTAGSDVHDVWVKDSGRVRTYVYVEGEFTIDRFVEALKAGNAYASQGPLVYPDILFGADIQQAANDELALDYTVQAVAGLGTVRLIERGNEVQATKFDGQEQPVPVSFSVRPDRDTWFSIVVEDQDGRMAWSNPVWVTIAQ